MNYHDLLNPKRPKPPGKETTCPGLSDSSTECSRPPSSTDCSPTGSCAPTSDPIVATVKALLDERSARGLAKYGTTLARTDLSVLDWLRHARDEALDMALYLTRSLECPPSTGSASGSLPSGSSTAGAIGGKETTMIDSANVDPWVTFRPAGESTMTDAAKFLRPLCGVCSKAEDPSKLLGTCEECRAKATGGTSGYTAAEVDANAGKWTPASVPDLVARVEVLEKRMSELQPTPRADLATILGKWEAETIEDAARRVMRRIEGAEDAFNRVYAGRNAAVMERDEAVRSLYDFALGFCGRQVVPKIDGGIVDRACRFLARHGLATDHEDGTFTLEEPKP